MDFEFTAEQQAIGETAQRFAQDKLAPNYAKREAAGIIDRALIKEMGQLGLIGAELPEEFGGLGTDSVTAGVIMEKISYADLNVGYICLLSSLNGMLIASHASRDMAQEVVTKIVAGESVVALGLTEPRGGSDAANLALTARRDGS